MKLPTTIASGINDLSGITGETNSNLGDRVIGILNAVVGVLGIVAVIVIVMGGVGYMTSGGDPGKTKKAKDTILYGVIGLIIVALSFVIVNFVIKNIIPGK